MMSLKNIKTLKDKMSEEQKRRLLVGLRKVKEELTGNVGGETDISNPDNLMTNENEFTGTGVPRTTEPNVIAKTFDTKADFDSYVNQRRGIQFTSKEIQAIQNHQQVRPTQLDRFQVRFESTDDFGNNDTTIIKKLKEGNQFCWTAFSKHETAEDEAKPEGQSDNPSDKPSDEIAEGLSDMISGIKNKYIPSEEIQLRSAHWLLNHNLTHWDYIQCLKNNNNNIDEAARQAAMWAITGYKENSSLKTKLAFIEKMESMNNPVMWKIFKLTVKIAKERIEDEIKNSPITEQEDSEEVTVDDPIRITKTITFTNETEGADILADFLEKLEL